MAGLYYELHPGMGPPVLLLHGMLSSRAQWRPNLSSLATAARPVVVEFWGHGRSEAPADDGAYTIPAIVSEYERIRRALGLSHWVVCGQSFSAGLALAYSLLHPERVRGLVLTNSNAAFAMPCDAIRAAERAKRIELLLRDGRAGLDAMPIHPRLARRIPSDIKAEMLADADQISPDAVARATRVTAEGLPHGHLLHAIRHQVLLLNGRFERRFQPHRDVAARELKHGRVVDLDAGHAVNIDAANAFCTHLTAFVRASS